MHLLRSPLLGLVIVLTGFALELRAGDGPDGGHLATPQVLATPQQPGLRIPKGLPKYDLAVRIDPAGRRVRARERVVFTNRSQSPVRELVFHVYPRYQVPEKDRLKLARTMEVLRLSPEEAMDEAGRRMEVSSVRLGDAPAIFSFDPGDGTILTVPLGREVPPGGQTTAMIDFTVELPAKWGRWGHYQGVTYLLNWYPVLAHHDDRGWDRTPFIPWHQPWYQDAGHYTVVADLPAAQVVASSGAIVGKQVMPGGWQRLTIEASPVRDFALVCSERFRTWEQRVGATMIRVHGLPGHEANAQLALDYACEVVPLYEKWFGPYPGTEFEIAPSFFGWNGNECSGLVLLDDRVMRLPSAGKRYIDHLVTHETCHQWWWNCVGTNGYAETFMDEGLVNCFTALRLDAKYGRNGPLIAWPKGLNWLPTIGREDLRLSGYYGWRRKGGGGPIIQDLNEMGNLLTLFSLAYDRGGKVIEMVHNRMGDERFFAFFRKLYSEYAYQTLQYADLKRELVAFDPRGDWPKFLEGWVESHRETDWAVQQVRVGPLVKADAEVRQVTVELEQKGEMHEPTVVLCRSAEGEVRVPIWPDRESYEVPGARVRREGGQWVVSMDAPGEPTQIEVDPDHALLDARPENNRWKPEISWRLTPLLTPLDTSSQFQSYDRVSAIAGPFVDQYARAGLKAGFQRLNRWQVIAWAGTEPALREAIFGGQATLYHLPATNWATGFFYEQGLYNFHNDKRHSGGRFFLRKRLLESSSFIVDDPVFFEVYYGLGNEFWPGDDGRPVNTYLGAVGLRYRQNTQFPYWDPVQGGLIDVAAEYGNALIASKLDYARVFAEYALVRKVPESWGILPNSRFAFRAYGGYSTPGNASLFRLGGGQRLRAIDLTSQEGSAVWLMTLEWRFPIWREINHDVLDHMLTFRHLYGAAFYDVGQSYLGGRWGPIVHGPGFGLRWDVILFSFLERATLRLDIAQPIGVKGGPVLWFGINQVF
ncbi:MAG: M1 family aminopeptidase [Isosphaeraceae bacterium]